MKNIKLSLLTAIVTGLVAVVVSTPLNIVFWGGTTGNVWGDAVYAWAIANNLPVFFASFIDEIIVDLPDKIAVLLIVFAISKSLPKSLVALYQSGDTIESLDN